MFDDARPKNNDLISKAATVKFMYLVMMTLQSGYFGVIFEC